ncbi:TPA: hypothetical protein ENS27_08805 [bacterium]|nr:hypothetical protein [bacterium]
MDFVKFGWQGITMEIPSNWELSALSGDYDNGYIRMDDENSSRMELKWSKTKEKKPDLQKILDEYFKGMRKRLGASADGLKIKRDVDLIKTEDFFKNRDVIFYNWKTDVRANGAIWYCKECKRVVVIQLMGYLKENILSDTIRILESVHDHPEGQNNLWSAYNFSVEVPRRYQMDKRKLMSGYISFSFIDGSRTLNVERYGLADVILKNADLESWFRSYYSKELRKYGFSINEISQQEPDLKRDYRLKMTGQAKRFIDKIPFSPLFAIDKLLRRKQIASYFWHCEESNRVFIVTAMSKKGADELVTQVASSINCHNDIQEIA